MSTKRPNEGVVLLARPYTHDASVPHAFNHTDGRCPKCASQQHRIVFCLQGQNTLPKVMGCEIDGEHLHRQCAACGYPWVEWCYDRLLQSQEEGSMLVESQLAAALACFAHRAGGVRTDQAVLDGYRGWTIRFRRDAERGTVIVTAEETPSAGEPVHPDLRPQGGAEGRGGPAA